MKKEKLQPRPSNNGGQRRGETTGGFGHEKTEVDPRGGKQPTGGFGRGKNEVGSGGRKQPPGGFGPKH